jgi:hypothetical protein
MAKLLGGDAPPAAGDAPMLASMAKIGIVPGQPFEMGKLGPAVQAALKDIPQTALKKIEANKNAMGEVVKPQRNYHSHTGCRYLGQNCLAFDPNGSRNQHPTGYRSAA